MDLASDRRRPDHGWGEHGGLADLVGPLSPELALVSEELATLARALLPDEPWESFLPTTTPSPGRAPVAVAGTAPLSRERHALEAPARAREPRSGLPVGRVVSALGLVAVGGALLIGSLPIVPDAPTLGSLASTPQAPSGGGPAAAPAAPSPAPLPVPGGGYVGAVVRFAVADDGRELRRILAVTGCSPTIALTQTSLHSDATFGARGERGKTVAAIVGRFVGERLARGELRIRGGRCGARRVPFVARLS